MKNNINLLAVLLLTLALSACHRKNQPDNAAIQNQAQQFLDKYNTQYQKFAYADNLAQWELNTHIVEGDTMAQHQASIASQNLADFTGSIANIDSTKKYLALKDKLSPIQVRQLDAILFLAGANPAAAGDLVKKRIDAYNQAIQTLYGFKFEMNGKEVSPNQIDGILRKSDNLNERLAAWTASKEVGKKLKPGLVELRDLRNKCVAPLNYKDYFAYNASQYGLSTDSLLLLTRLRYSAAAGR